MIKIKTVAYLLCLFLFACEEVPAPKPTAYYRIDLPKRTYRQWDGDCAYGFRLSSEAQMNPSKDSAKACYFDLVYPRFNATLYLSYLPVQDDLKALIDQEYALREKHNAFATGVKERVYRDNKRKVSAMLFEIEGIKAATPVQLFITDSAHHFFRGALYFYNTPNNDSLAPVIAYIKQDIDTLVESFYWKE